MYCKRCDRDDVGNFHRCFFYGFHPVRPLKNRPQLNTALARKLALIYEKELRQPFPGGIENAKISRDQAGMNRAWRDAGSWVWSLQSIDTTKGMVWGFGSPETATKCAKEGRVLDDVVC